jgi:hypothetical protein
LSIVAIKIPETPVPGKPLGRHIFIDSKSEAYPAQTASQIVSVTHLSGGLPLNQGQVGSCTGEAVTGVLNTVPHYKPGQPTLGQRDAYAVYGAETRLEGSPWPPNDPGGSGTEVCQAAKNMGWLRAYEHAVGIDQALGALVIRPVMTGINWFTSFDTPDENGLVVIAKGATVRGGHEIFAIAIDAVNELVWFPNSWGLAYGVPYLPAGIPGGCFCMSFSTWARLLSQGGDVTIPRTALGWVASPLPA